MSLNSLFTNMAKDMSIPYSEFETSEKYISRLIYSGLGEWIKSAIYDRDIDADVVETEIGASKIHITERVNGILSSFIDIIDDDNLRSSIKNWFYPDDIIKPVQEIRNRLILGGVLVSDDKNTLQHSQLKSMNISDNLYYYRGINKVSSNNLVIGLGTYSEINPSENTFDLFEMYQLQKESAEEFVIKYLKNANLTSGQKQPSVRQYFNIKSTYSFSKSWVTKLPKDGVTIYKDNDKDYGIIKIKNNNTYEMGFSKSTIDLSETRRFLYGLKAINNNSSRAIITKNGEYCKIKLPSFLPEKELNALYMLAWPSRHILDKTEFITNVKLIPTIETMLKNLSIMVIIK